MKLLRSFFYRFAVSYYLCVMEITAGLSLLRERLRRLPMLRALVPLAVGIWCADRFALPLWFPCGALLLCGLLAWMLRSSLYTAAAVAALGLTVGSLPVPADTMPRDRQLLLALECETYPADRGGYSTAPAVITAWRTPDGREWQAVRRGVMLYADSALTLRPGERLLCRARIRDFSARYPDYRCSMLRRGYVGRVSLSSRQLLGREPIPVRGALHAGASERIRRLGLAPDAEALTLAVAAGDRSALRTELREAYARSGVAHLLAVSGLHVGIVFALANLLLRWLVLLRRGHRLRNLLVVAVVWLYTAVAGFPPSAVRAAAMFSVLQFAWLSGSTYVGLNALSATAFVMLVCHPPYLFDLGFRLSFTAVAAILAWSVPLYARLRIRRHPRSRSAAVAVRAADLLLGTLSVGVAASVATAPLLLRTFGYVSFAGVVVTPVVLVAAWLLVGGALVWMVVPLPLLAPLFRTLLDAAAALQNAIVVRSAAWSGAAIGGTLPDWAAAGCYLFFVAATLAAWCVETKKTVSLPA